MFPERHWNVNGVKTLLNKLMLLEVSTDIQVVVARAVHTRLPVSVKLKISYWAKKIIRRVLERVAYISSTDCGFCIKYLLSNFRVMIR